jgi:hypothetical protein
MRVTQRLLSILGRRPFSAFGLVTFLVAALLATVNITSRHALKMYVEDQLQRIPWDLAVYQRGSAGNQVDRLRARVADVPGVTRAETLVFLRARFPEGDDVVAEVAGKPLTTPWLCLLAASDMSILPPELGFALGRKLPQAAAPPPTTVASGGNGNGNTNGTTDQAGQGAGHEHPPGTPPHDDAPAPRAATRQTSTGTARTTSMARPPSTRSRHQSSAARCRGGRAPSWPSWDPSARWARRSSRSRAPVTSSSR